MTKRALCRYLHDKVGLSDWTALPNLPGNFGYSRRIGGGTEMIIFQALQYGGLTQLNPGLGVRREYDPVASVFERAGVESSNSLQISPRRDKELSDVSFVNEADAHIVVEPVRSMVCEDILPELERYRYLGPLHALIEATDPTLRSGKFGSKPHQAHIAIIKRLVGAADWESYMTHWEKVYREYVQTPEGAKFTKEAEILTRLSELLPDVTPLSTQEAWGPEGNMEAS